MPTGEGLDKATKAKRGTVALQVIWIPSIAMVVAILATWLMRPAINSLLTSGP